MQITSARVIVCCPGRNFVTLKIETDAGLTGLGGIGFSNGMFSGPLGRALPLRGGPWGSFGLAERTMGSGRLVA